jgi:aminopeptidase N
MSAQLELLPGTSRALALARRARHAVRTAMRLLCALSALLPAVAAAQSVADVDDNPVPLHRREEAALKGAALSRMRALRKDGGRSGVMPAAVSPNQASYDVTWYKLVLDLDPSTQIVAGTVTMRARVVSGPLSAVELDLDLTMAVSAARAAGLPAVFSHPGAVLTVNLDRAYATGEAFTIDVDYAGTPNPVYGSFGFDTRLSQPLIWSLSEPFGARAWWPCKDDPSDKADSVRVVATVPSNLIVASNGVLTGTTLAGVKKTYSWNHRYPIAAYLVSVTAHPFTVQTVNYAPLAGGSMPVTVWSYPDQAASAFALANTTVQILGVYAARFGEYPFTTEKYGQAQFPWGGGMEHQTCTSLCCWDANLISHELGHQWFGDAVTCRSFSDIWLNEGFATYCEALWDESQGGTAAYWANILADRYYGSGTIWVPPADLGNFNRIFDGNLSYNKGAWVLHMLRGIVGDTTFFNILRTYEASPTLRYGTATTADLQAVAETVSGLDLSDFFHDWIYVPYCPTYSHTWSATPNGGSWNLTLTIEQLQSQELYTMPIRVRVTTLAGIEEFVVQNSLASQTYALTTAAQPLIVDLDPDQWILRTIENPIGTPTFHRGVLVVNGVSWSSYGAEITTAFQDSAFSGRSPFSFWDCFPPPAGGYVAQVPAPLGNGALPASVLGQFSTVIWVGNNFGVDLDVWTNAAILSYLKVGGNVLLLGRQGQDFLTPARASYPGIRWAESPTNTIQSATAAHPAMVTMSPLGPQTLVAVFETGFDRSESTLLFSETQSFATTRALGVWRHPLGGGTQRHSGGHFAHIAGRPYRWTHASLRTNIQAILQQLFHEPATPTAAPPALVGVTRLQPPAPNPFNPRVEVRFSLARAGRMRLAVYDLRGRLVRTLVDAVQPAGEDAAVWDGLDDGGAAVASGVYTLRMDAAGQMLQQKATLIR